MRLRRIGLLALLALGLAAGPARGQEAGTCVGAPEVPAAAPAAPAPAPAAPAASGPRWADAAFAAVALGVAIFGIGYVRRNERRRRSTPAAPVERAPYVAGGALGVLVALSLAALGRPVGISGGFQHLTGIVGHRITGDYWGPVIPFGVTWPAWVIAGVLVGGFLGALTEGTLRFSAVPTGAGRSLWRRWLAVFIGGALLEYAAAIAGGCTSGLALSGGIGLAPGAFVFMAAMFAAGVPAARLARRHP
jgi:hypothetical protein